MVMTTSRFAPGITNDASMQAIMPCQLELMDGQQLRACPDLDFVRQDPARASAAATTP
jgi:hypothetical protein